MSRQYYILEEKKKTGPYTHLQIHEMLVEAELKAEALAWYRGCSDWSPLADMEEFDQSKPKKTQDQPEENEANLTTSQTSSPDSHPPTISSWRRFWARWIDFIIFSTFIGILMNLILKQSTLGGGNSPSLDWRWLALLGILLTLIEAALLSMTGTTPGKNLLGLRLENKEGLIPHFKATLRRSLLVWVGGVGLYFFPLCLLTAWLTHRQLSKHNVAAWDKGAQPLQLVAKQPSKGQLLLATIIIVSHFVFHLLFLFMIMQKMASGEIAIPGLKNNS